jgi:putative ABC transport system ATP-binding protein
MAVKKPGIALEAKGLVKSYKMSKKNVIKALNKVSLEVEKGEMVAIMGPSGSGKSTLLHLMATLDKPDEGEVVINGVSVFAVAKRRLPKIRATQIGMIFQSYNLIPTLSARENVALAMRYAGVGRRERHRRADEMLGNLGLADRLNNKPTELSGGQQQRVAVARALVNNPDIVFADEPTGELDTKNSQQLMEVLRDLNKKQQQTFVIVTHNPEVARVCDRTIYMQDSKIAEKKIRV